MKGARSVWLIVAAALVIVGSGLFVATMVANGWNFRKLNTEEYQNKTHTVSESFQSISMELDTANVSILPAEDGQCRVVCWESVKQTHDVAVQEGILTITENNQRSWYEFLNIGFNTAQVTLYLPQKEYEALVIRSHTGDVAISHDFGFAGMEISLTTGDVQLADLTADRLALSVSTGRVTVNSVTCQGNIGVKVSTGKTQLTDVRCKDFSSTGSTGDIILENMIAEGTLTVERTTGDVRLNGVDAENLDVKTDTGDVKGSLLSEKVFITKTDTGSVKVPQTTSGGECRISADTGDIKITVE